MEEGKSCCGAAHDGRHCSCSHHKIVPIILVIIGASFLLTQLGIITVVANSYIWPVSLILIGLMKLMSGNCKCYKA